MRRLEHWFFLTTVPQRRIMNSMCPTCKAILRVPANAAGKTGKCPNCLTKFTISQQATTVPVSNTPPPPYEEVFYSGNGDEPPPTAIAKMPETQQCPFCDSTITAKAKKCRECGETVDVALRAAEEAKREARESRRRSGGGNQQQVVIHQSHNDYRDRYRPAFPHVLHLVLTLLTMGLWSPIWLIHWIIWECSR
jgi:DNA-directed RNA polymerase subunit M/transcription elongation factor TFIIS